MNTNEIYIDQASSVLNTPNVQMFSSYTPHGVRSIESNYIFRIQNLESTVKSVFQINHRPKIIFSAINGEEVESFYDTFYDEVSPFNAHKGLGLRVICEDKYGSEQHRDFYHGDNIPKYYNKTLKENPQQLINEIINDPHLHQVIKDNLLENLEYYEHR